MFDRQGRALAVLEAKSTSINLNAGEAQGRRYSDQLNVPFVFLSNGDEVWFCDVEQDAHFRKFETVFSQDDLVRRRAARGIRRSPLDIPIDRRIAGGGGRNYQITYIDILCREIVNGRRKMLVEMATGTGKTLVAAALLKRLFGIRQQLPKHSPHPTSRLRLPRTSQGGYASGSVGVCGAVWLPP